MMSIDKFFTLAMVAGLGLLSLSVSAYSYWNGTRYVETRNTVYPTERVSPASTIMPDDFEDKEEFLKLYYAQEIDKLTDAQRNEDRKTLGGVAARRMRIRRIGEKLWKEAHENKTKTRVADAGDSLLQEDLKSYLQGRPLVGLFGIKLGATVDPEQYERIGTSNTYIFQPKKNFRGYKKYAFSITPISHQIYGIRASGFEFGADLASDIKSEWEATKSAFEKRFEKKAKLDIGTMVCPNFKLLFPGKGKTVERVIEVTFGSSITAIDLKLKQLSADEMEIANRKTLEENLQTDVDAL